MFTCSPGELYVSDKCGSDQDGDGTEPKPFKTPLKVHASGWMHGSIGPSFHAEMS